jgi:sugar phosphate isomerase/epimerase
MATHSLGIEFLTVFGLPPVQFVRVAAAVGCQHVSLGVTPYPRVGPYGYEPFDLRKDATLRTDLRSAMDDCGVSIGLADGFGISAHGDVSALASNLDLLAELGAPRVNTIVMEPDRARYLDQIAKLCQMASERDMVVTVETAPGFPVGDLAAGVEVITTVGAKNLQLLIDTMHVCRTGSTPEDIAALDPALIGYVQLSDVPLVSPYENYFDEAMWHRHCPGDGELPLRELLAAIPDGVPISVEVPNLEEAEAGRSPHDRVQHYLDATRALLTQ